MQIVIVSKWQTANGTQGSMTEIEVPVHSTVYAGQRKDFDDENRYEPSGDAVLVIQNGHAPLFANFASIAGRPSTTPLQLLAGSILAREVSKALPALAEYPRLAELTRALEACGELAVSRMIDDSPLTDDLVVGDTVVGKARRDEV
jgi:hypothetical protein